MVKDESIQFLSEEYQKPLDHLLLSKESHNMKRGVYENLSNIQS